MAAVARPYAPKAVLTSSGNTSRVL